MKINVETQTVIMKSSYWVSATGPLVSKVDMRVLTSQPPSKVSVIREIASAMNLRSPLDAFFTSSWLLLVVKRVNWFENQKKDLKILVSPDKIIFVYCNQSARLFHPIRCGNWLNVLKPLIKEAIDENACDWDVVPNGKSPARPGAMFFTFTFDCECQCGEH